MPAHAPFDGSLSLERLHLGDGLRVTIGLELGAALVAAADPARGRWCRRIPRLTRSAKDRWLALTVCASWNHEYPPKISSADSLDRATVERPLMLSHGR